ncbi:hypothetical protein [Blastococcus aurantiacus]|nr:hypothetical protein [Blastococcus aurantiacus]
MDDNWIAEAHRRIGDAQHGVARRMLKLAGSVPDPEEMRRRAFALAASADRHLVKAAQLDDGAKPR